MVWESNTSLADRDPSVTNLAPNPPLLAAADVTVKVAPVPAVQWLVPPVSKPGSV